nr:hypothetical protein [Pyxidicoccus caerfyrddinensis]
MALMVPRDGLRPQTGLRLEQPFQAGVLRRGSGGLVPRLEQQVTLSGCEHGQRGEAALRRGEGLLQQRAKVADHAARGRRVEKVGVVLQHALEPLVRVAQCQRQVELRGAALHLDAVKAQARAHHLGHGRVLIREHHLEEGRAARIPLGPQRLHQLLEGDVLVLVRPERHVAHAAEQLAEGRVSVQPSAQHQRVDEEADEPLQLGVVPAGDGRAHADVLLSAVAGQQGLERGEHHHGRRDALAAAERVHRIRQRAGELEGPGRATEGLGPGTRAVGGKLQGARCAVELSPPPAELCLQRFIAQPAALPEGEVRILHRQRLQLWRPALQVGCIQGGQFLDEHAHGPRIGDDMVHGQQQHVALLAQAHQEHAPERAGFEVEDLSRLVLDEGPQRGLLLRHCLQVHPPGGEWRLGSDDLDWACFCVAEGRAQGLVALLQGPQGACEGGHVEHAFQSHGRGQVVGGAFGLQLREEPQALLREGQGQAFAARRGLERRHRERVPHGTQGLQAAGHGLHCGRGEEVSQGQLHLERAADAREDLRGAQGVATQLEEVVLGAHRSGVEHLCIERREQLLGVRARSPRGRAAQQGGIRCGQGLAVHLAVGREREGVQHHHGRGHHVLGQPLLEQRAERSWVGRLGAHHITHEELVTRRILASEHHCLSHPVARQQGGFDFGQFDAVAAHLHLGIRTTEELQHAVTPPAREVTGAVEPCSGHTGEGVRNEALRGESGLAHVATGHAIATDEQLSGDSHGHGLAGGIQQIHLRVSDGPADGDGGAHVGDVRHAVAGGEEGALGGAVAGRHRNAQLLQHPAHMRRAHHVTTGEQLLHTAQCGEAVLHHLGEQARREVQRGDPVLHQHGFEFLQVAGRTWREDDELGPMQQRPP